MIWRRKRKPTSPDVTEARQMLRQARENLADARADDDHVNEVTQKLVELRRKNHFGPMITEALRGSR